MTLEPVISSRPAAPGVRAPRALRLLCATLLAGSSLAMAAGSQCHGTVSRGRLEGGVQLPLEGANFVAYSRVAAAAGRTHVHSAVAQVMVAAYADLARSQPGVTLVYGETGRPQGGRLRPHRTHQNGLSVDFFVPVRDGEGRAAPLPTPASEQWGYDIEFDAEGRWNGHRIDFAALAAHLVALKTASEASGVGIKLVIVDPQYLPRLFATPQGPVLRRLPFMKGKPWVRHDEHYHVDFDVPCRPV